MEKVQVPMQQYPQSPDVTSQQQPPVYHQDPNAQQPYPHEQPQQQQPMYEEQPDAAAAMQPGMPPQQQSGTVYQNATPIANLQRGPAPADCPACGQRAMTNVAFDTGNTTHVWAFVLCCVCCLGCIPYVMNSTKDVQHKCGRCGVLLATWHRSGSTEVHMHS
ncbi:lipopolysaccharide-induced transcription factor regulating tumor necrosis factor protein [Pyrenophora tritici-repentis]|uniref:LITAF domain-containing protein n=1 Tax=Pyrenophora tritici-repentis (strain Pt-1C-BFP) TaxID=426418 RepID=B2WFC0_PYRTR|nr:uncharacterized protein PTRG_08281 [Pyrenophora tritici-repentis Pt-1C-BFP]KAI0578528.1 lipopolysaccharide-induced transcription factor regulating tumor necrosis factor [Pyrenophora tritici-repentis]EDU51200.1 conserved hypothetical protein [Pyrenophora tritici-repentis Pt-1C-BFP]KAI0583624.1 lipopolysaccharide-induced transcription factor regulating tumor necrosis factor [Pyrenophora tritici-repentis]KAI0610365.1 lipopolysaccharide-induced transcription factor regulating tumor necrosis fact